MSNTVNRLLKNKKGITKFSIGLAIIMFFISCLPFYVNATDMNNDFRAKQIEDLIKERSELILKSDENYLQIERINQELTLLGVDFLSAEEVQEKFPNPQDSGIATYAYDVVPVSKDNDWMSYTFPATYNGKKYDIIRLIATPKNENSVLYEQATRIKQYNKKYNVGVEFISAAANYAGGKFGGMVYGDEFSGILSFFDVIDRYVRGIGHDVIVSEPHITYTYSLSTYVCFEFVGPTNGSDSQLKICSVSSTCQGEMRYTMPMLDTKGEWGPVGKLISGECSIYVNPANSPSYQNPNVCQIYETGKTVYQQVQSIDIAGLNGEKAFTIYPRSPSYPIQIGN